MLKRLREQTGTAGLVVAIVALAFAMLGGAYAATHSARQQKKGSAGLTSKQKREVKKLAMQFAGKPGAPGAQGPQGSPGSNGSNGTNGTDGSDGNNGASVILVNTSPAGCPDGGFTYEIEGSEEEDEVCQGEEGEPGESPVGAAFTGGTEPTGNPCAGAGGVEYEIESTGDSQIVCNGTEGSPWTVNSTLPEGIHAEEHGTWLVSTQVEVPENPGLWGQIAFPIRLGTGGTSVYYSTDAEYTTFCEDKGVENVLVKDTAPAKTLCLKTVEVPAAATFVGVYKANRGAIKTFGPVGAWVRFKTTGAAEAWGVWALQG
jgi:hypothetical protein